MNIKTANRLCELRKKHNLSQEELAAKLGVSRQAVSKWERSESSPDTDNLIELAKIYNMTLDDLLNGDDAIDLINENKNSNNEHIDESKLENNKDKKFEAIKNSLAGAYTIIATAVYVTLGIMLKDNNGWKYFWFLFLLIPVIPSICIMIYKRKITAFCYPMAITAAYCGFSMYYNLWHPLWILFLTIPVFYIVFSPIDKLITKNNDNENKH